MKAAGLPVTSPDTGTRGEGSLGQPCETALVKATALLGLPVHNPEHVLLGTVLSVMLDVIEGTVAYVVLKTELGKLGERLLAIPWAALTLDAEHRHFVFKVDAMLVANDRGFDPEHWPTLADLSWISQVEAYAGVPLDVAPARPSA